MLSMALVLVRVPTLGNVSMRKGIKRSTSFDRSQNSGRNGSPFFQTSCVTVCAISMDSLSMRLGLQVYDAQC